LASDDYEWVADLRGHDDTADEPGDPPERASDVDAYPPEATR
jgi:hypothetical protein